ncbi:MAG: HNH endonuclease [Candidatus Thiothrix putei]|uniref:HNH endonuclease n=1 Tax=Candidatus Thiothrix putei TaxID=3080811 RepID=A0AA95KHI3_9GAMM|nr:MAG: HNH endonuclease [Candidatus Thiothrix putei]
MTITADIRQQVHQRAGCACEFCGVTEESAASELTIDHYQPQAKGGSDDIENLVYSCPKCNNFKSDDWPVDDQPALWNPRVDPATHAPTMSFPVAGTLMIEPTESEPKAELDRFCDAMIAIREEIRKVQEGVWPLDNNPLVNAPHTLDDLVNAWERPYSQTEAVFPQGVSPTAKYWPTVNRIDNVYGDRNLVCSCPSVDSYR